MNKRHSDRVLDSKLAISLIGSESPNDLIVNNEAITRVGNLCEVPHIRKLNISFNNILSLDGVDQLPQLRILYAYSCNLDNIACIQAVGKLEQLFLQDNNISNFTPSFTALVKLQHLRMDHNKITNIENLQNCSNLKILDLSRNNISNVESLNGLQNLSELHLNNNNIKSLTTLRALPNLKELDLSHNQVKAIDFGLLAAQLPSLEVLNLNHNVVSLLVHNAVGSASATASAAATANNIKKKTSTKTSSGTQLPPTANLRLSELYLSGNRIKSLSAMSSLHDSLEVLDISNNSFVGPPNPAADELITSLCKFTLLTELRMNNNDCCADVDFMGRLVAAVTGSCTQLTAVDGLSIVQGASSTAPSSRGRQLEDDEEGDNALGFHTWPADSQSVVLTASETIDASSALRAVSRSVYVHSDSDNSDDEEETKQSELQNKTVADDLIAAASDESRWRLKPMVSEGAILQKEDGIRSLLGKCKDMLSLVTVFNVMSYEEQDRQEKLAAQGLSATAAEAIDERKVEGPVVKSRVEALIDNYHMEQVQDRQQFVADKPSVAIAREPLLAAENSRPQSSDRAPSSKSRRFAEHKEESMRQDEALLSPRQQQDVVRIAMPKAIESESETDQPPVVAVPRPAYKPAMHSSVRSTSVASSKSLSGIALETVSAVPDDVSVASSSARSTTTTGTKDATKKKKTSKPVASSSLSSTGMSAAEKFSSEIAKLGAPLGSGLSRHGTKTNSTTRQSSTKQQASSSVVFSSGDNAVAMVQSSASSSGVEAQHLSGVRITKRDTKQHFLDGGSDFATSALPVDDKGAEDEAQSKDDSPLSPQSRAASVLAKHEHGGDERGHFADDKSGSELASDLSAGAKSSGRFGHSYVVLDPRDGAGGDQTQQAQQVSTLFERYHNMHASSITDLKHDATESFSPVAPPPAPFALSLPQHAQSKDEGGESAVSPLFSGLGSEHGPNTITTALNNRAAFRVSAHASSIPQPVAAPSNTYKRFKIPEQARSVIRGPDDAHKSSETKELEPAPDSSGHLSGALSLSNLESNVLRLSTSSTSSTEVTSLAYSKSPRPLNGQESLRESLEHLRLSHSANEL